MVMADSLNQPADDATPTEQPTPGEPCLYCKGEGCDFCGHTGDRQYDPPPSLADATPGAGGAGDDGGIDLDGIEAEVEKVARFCGVHGPTRLTAYTVLVLVARCRSLTHERDALRAAVELPEAVTAWWPCAGLLPPFTPGKTEGNNDGIVRDASGYEVANCNGHEARADVIAALLNHAAAALARGPAADGQG